MGWFLLLLRRAYVAVMLQVVGRGLAAASRVDAGLRSELTVLPEGYLIEMLVLPRGPCMQVRADGNGRLTLIAPGDQPPSLSIRFKHLSHAWMVLSFREGTAQAFANDRMVADGDVAVAIRLVRCLNRLESLILPAAIARRAVKRYQPLGLKVKLAMAARIYGLLVWQALSGADR